MSVIRRAIAITGFVLLCAAIALFPRVQNLPAAGLDLTMRGSADSSPRSLAPAPSALQPTAATRLRASRVLRIDPAAIPPAGIVAPAPVSARFEASLALSPDAALLLRAPSGRAPPIL